MSRHGANVEANVDAQKIIMISGVGCIVVGQGFAEGLGFFRLLSEAIFEGFGFSSMQGEFKRRCCMA